MRLCKIDECNRGVVAKGYCNKHYQQVKKHGEIKPDIERIDRYKGVRYEKI